jgi:hypothetical protein
MAASLRGRKPESGGMPPVGGHYEVETVKVENTSLCMIVICKKFKSPVTLITNSNLSITYVSHIHVIQQCFRVVHACTVC